MTPRGTQPQGTVHSGPAQSQAPFNPLGAPPPCATAGERPLGKLGGQACEIVECELEATSSAEPADSAHLAPVSRGKYCELTYTTGGNPVEAEGPRAKRYPHIFPSPLYP